MLNQLCSTLAVGRRKNMDDNQFHTSFRCPDLDLSIRESFSMFFSLCFEQIPSQRADKLFIFAHYPQNQRVKQWSNKLLAHANSSSCNTPWAKHTHTHIRQNHPGTSSIAPALILRVRFCIRVRHHGATKQVLATNPRQLNRLTTESPLRPVIKLPNYTVWKVWM